MQATFKLDTSQFNEGLKKAIELSSRSGAQVINSRAFHAAAKAIPATKKASRQQIEQELGRIGTSLKVTKSGKLSRTRAGAFKGGSALVREDSLAARIILARIRNAGAIDHMPHGAALAKAAAKLIASRVRSIGFIRSGWISAMRDFSRYAFGASKPPMDGVKVVGQKKGKGTPAKPKVGKMVATLENSALLIGGRNSSVASNPVPIAEAGMKIALQSEYAEMARHMAEKLKPDFKRAGFRVA